MKIIIVYKSQYGSSRQYAQWLADMLNCTTAAVSDINLTKLQTYDVIVYIGGLYAGSVNGYKQLRKLLPALSDKKMVLCMVGSTNPAAQEKYQAYFTNNVPEQYRDIVTPFALRGDQLFSRMSGLHRLMMNVPKAATNKIPAAQRTADDRDFLANFGRDIHYAKPENLHDAAAYIKGLSR